MLQLAHIHKCYNWPSYTNKQSSRTTSDITVLPCSYTLNDVMSSRTEKGGENRVWVREREREKVIYRHLGKGHMDFKWFG